MGVTGSTLFILGHDLGGRVRCMRAGLPVRSCTVELFDGHTRQPVSTGQYQGDAFKGEIAVSVDLFSAPHALFVKLERRPWFFDESGWLEIPPVVNETQIATTCPARSAA